MTDRIIDGDNLDPALFSARENHTIRVSTLLTPDEFTWSVAEADRRDMSQSAYIRDLIRKDRNKVEMAKLSSEKLSADTPETAHILYTLSRLIKDHQP